MWDKIKAFFQNKIVKAVELIVLVLIAICLIIGGVKLDDIKSVAVAAAGIVDAVAVVAVLISTILK